MILSKQDLRNFVRLVGALDPWLKDLVIIGGWAYRFYRFLQGETWRPFAVS
jgi:hypothetical protein